MPGPDQHIPRWVHHPFVHACLPWYGWQGLCRVLHTKVSCGYTVIWPEASKIVWMQLLCLHTIQGHMEW